MASDKNVIDDFSSPLITSSVHHGQNIAKLRDLFDWTQRDLAEKLGWRQQRVSELEEKAVIEDEILIEVAEVFGVSAEKLKYSNVKESAINIFKDNDIRDGGILCVHGSQTFNQGVEPVLKLSQELREKDKEVFEAKLEVKEIEIQYAKKRK